MKLHHLRISNFRSFGPGMTEIDFQNLTFLIGPNGAGKTALLRALSHLFDFSPNARRVQPGDFHIPIDETPDKAPNERTLFIEADFVFPELADETKSHPTIPPNFAHMRLETAAGPAKMRFRLDATIDQAREIEEEFNYVLRADDKGQPLNKAIVPRADRSSIHIHYLPARRDPSDHISYTATSLIGRLLRSANWTAEKENIKGFTKQISDCLSANPSVTFLSQKIDEAWKQVHRGTFFADPEISFVESQIETVLRHLSVSFGPGHGEDRVDFARLSDGQKSMLYLSLVIAIQRIGIAVLGGKDKSFDIGKLKPPIFTMVAMEEPENSLSPHYLGRVTNALAAFSAGDAAQAFIATHSPSMLRRVAPEAVRYIKLDEKRNSVVTSIVLPATADEAHKFVREAVQAFPELYFSRLAILCEGDSEEIVVPRLIRAKGLGADESAISVVPLGGRHVNHFWRLLHGLGIPHVTLLDLDLARHQGGWGRIRYAAKQLLLFAPATCGIEQKTIDELPAWNVDPQTLPADQMTTWISYLEGQAVFFSAPLDLDMSMIEQFRSSYGISPVDLVAPTNNQLKAVLGDSFERAEQYTEDQQKLFVSYHRIFKLGSKPAAHLNALASLTDAQLLAAMPPTLNRLAEFIANKLGTIPE